MNGVSYTHIIETLLTIVPVAVGFVWAIKSETRVLKERLDGVDRTLAKMDNVLVILAENKGRMDLIESRALLTGQRVDELISRFNQLVDSKSIPKHPY